MPKPKRKRNYPERPCEWCSDKFKPKREHGRYCCTECRRDAWHDRTYIKREDAK